LRTVLSLRTEQNCNALTARCVHVPAAACIEACTRSNTNVLILSNHVVLDMSQVMSSKATEEKALDMEDTHWSGVVKGGDFTATFTDADKVGSKTTLPLGKVCVCHIFCCIFCSKHGVIVCDSGLVTCACVCVCVHGCMRICVHACMRSRWCVCICVCMRACVCTGMQACARMCVCARVYMHVCTCVLY